jgi:hypothetical protein
MLAWLSQCRTVWAVGAAIMLPCPNKALSVADAVILRLRSVVLALVSFAAAVLPTVCLCQRDIVLALFSFAAPLTKQLCLRAILLACTP